MTQVDAIRYVLFFVDKKSVINSDEIVFSIGIETLEQFCNSTLVEKLRENTVPVNLFKNVCLKNLFIFNSEDGNFKLDSNLYSSIDVISTDCIGEESEQDSADSSIELSNETFARRVFVELRNDLGVKAYDFVKLNGLIINIIQESFSYFHLCSTCGKQNKKIDQNLSQRFDSRMKLLNLLNTWLKFTYFQRLVLRSVQ